MDDVQKKGQDPDKGPGDESKKNDHPANAQAIWAKLKILKENRDKRKKFKARVKKRADKQMGWGELSLDQRIRLIADVEEFALQADYGGPQNEMCLEKMLVKDKKRKYEKLIAENADKGDKKVSKESILQELVDSPSSGSPLFDGEFLHGKKKIDSRKDVELILETINGKQPGVKGSIGGQQKRVDLAEAGPILRDKVKVRKTLSKA